MRLVLLHALPFDGRMWDSLGPLAAAAYVPNLYRLGDSIREWATAVLSQCSDEELLVVGNSVGGSCALEMARTAPDRVRGIVLVGAKAGVRRDPEARDQAVQLLRTEGVEAAWDRYWAPLFGASVGPKTRAAARQLALEQDVDDLITGVRAFHDRRDHTRFVRNWSGRLLLMSGAEDQSPSPLVSAAEVMGTQIDQIVVEGSGHYVPLEQPGLVEQIIREQLRLWQPR